MKRLLTRGAMLALALWLVAPAPSAWAAATLRIQNPNDPNGSSYNEWPSTSIVTGNIGIHFEASSTSGLAWSQIDFLGLPGWPRETIHRDPAGTGTYSASSGKGTPSNPLTYDFIWDTTDPSELGRGFNGTFTIRFFAKEQLQSEPNCTSTTRINCVDRKFKVNNPPSPVEWVSGPTSSKEDGRPVVRIVWSYSGNEPDMREFQIFRDGALIANMNFAGPGTYDFEDKSYGDTGYGGSHTYSVAALRTSSVGSTYKCSTSGTYGSACVGRASGNRAVTLSEPKPTTGTTPGGSPTSGGGGTKGGTNPGFRPAPVGTIIVGGRQIQRSACPDCHEFYEGSYSTSLPYAQDRTVLIPSRTGGQSGGGSNRLEALAGEETSSPIGVPIRDRAVLLPFAGGLLLFLAAAHVRRLLRRI